MTTMKTVRPWPTTTATPARPLTPSHSQYHAIHHQSQSLLTHQRLSLQKEVSNPSYIIVGIQFASMVTNRINQTEDNSVMVPSSLCPGPKRQFYPFAVQHETLFHTIMYCSAAHLARLQGNDPPPEALYHHSQALRLFNQRLEAGPSGADLHALISSTCLMFALEVRCTFYFTTTFIRQGNETDLCPSRHLKELLKIV